MKLKVTLLILPLSLLLSVSAFTKDGWIPQTIESTKAEYTSGYKILTGSLVHFKNGKRLWSDLIKMKYIGRLSTDPDSTFLLFSGRSCDPCGENISIFILNPKDDSFRLASKTKRYIYPGNLYAFGPDKRRIREARLFVGDCFYGYYSIAIWYINSKQSSGKWQKSVTIVEIINGKIKSSYLKHPLPDIDETLSFVKGGKCIEVPGREITEEP